MWCSKHRYGLQLLLLLLLLFLLLLLLLLLFKLLLQLLLLLLMMILLLLLILKRLVLYAQLQPQLEWGKQEEYAAIIPGMQGRERGRHSVKSGSSNRRECRSHDP